MSKSQDRLNALAEEVHPASSSNSKKALHLGKSPGTASPVARTIRSLHHSTRARIGFVCKWLQKCKGFLILAG